MGLPATGINGFKILELSIKTKRNTLLIIFYQLLFKHCLYRLQTED